MRYTASKELRTIPALPITIFLVCDTVKSCRWLSNFRSMLFPFSGSTSVSWGCGQARQTGCGQVTWNKGKGDRRQIPVRTYRKQKWKIMRKQSSSGQVRGLLYQPEVNCLLPSTERSLHLFLHAVNRSVYDLLAGNAPILYRTSGRSSTFLATL